MAFRLEAFLILPVLILSFKFLMLRALGFRAVGFGPPLAGNVGCKLEICKYLVLLPTLTASADEPVRLSL